MTYLEKYKELYLELSSEESECMHAILDFGLKAVLESAEFSDTTINNAKETVRVARVATVFPKMPWKEGDSAKVTPRAAV